MRIVYLSTAILIALPAFAQKYEFGVLGGVSLYDKKTVTNPRGTADAGFKPGYVAGVTLGHNTVSTYRWGDPLYVPSERNETVLRIDRSDIRIAGAHGSLRCSDSCHWSGIAGSALRCFRRWHEVLPRHRLGAAVSTAQQHCDSHENLRYQRACVRWRRRKNADDAQGLAST